MLFMAREFVGIQNVLVERQFRKERKEERKKGEKEEKKEREEREGKDSNFKYSARIQFQTDGAIDDDDDTQPTNISLFSRLLCQFPLTSIVVASSLPSLPLDRRVASCVDATIYINRLVARRAHHRLYYNVIIDNQRLMFFDGRFVGVHNTIGNINISKERRFLQCYYLECIERECISKIICITFYTSYYAYHQSHIFIYCLLSFVCL